MKLIKPDADDIGQRLDRYLRKILPGAKLGEIYEALRTKKITIGGKKLPENTKLRAGDVVTFYMSDSILELWQKKEVSQKYIHQKLDPSRILYQDADILIYDKPAGLIVHSPDHKTDEVSLIEQIEDYLVASWWKPTGTFAHPALAHRIDRDTSGVIISCLNRISYEYMAEQFRTRKVEKTYVALVEWIPEPREGIINAPLLRLDTGRTDEAKVVVDPKGQSAETSYKVLPTSSKYQVPSIENKEIPNPKLGTRNSELSWSLVELHPKTWRTHQIRVHMAYIGHPLIGDKRYAWPSITRFPELAHVQWRKGHLLHAQRIEFSLPSKQNERITITTSKEWFTQLYPNFSW